LSLLAVTGGTGTLGQNLVSAALARGHEVRVISRRAGAMVADGASLAVADVLTGEGLDHRLDGAEVVIHAATSPLRRSRATEVEGTGRAVRSAERAAAHLIYVSIVGVDRHHFPYYRARLAAEQIAATAHTTWAINRATQFHQLIDRAAGRCGLPCDSQHAIPTGRPRRVRAPAVRSGHVATLWTRPGLRWRGGLVSCSGCRLPCRLRPPSAPGSGAPRWDGDMATLAKETMTSPRDAAATDLSRIVSRASRRATQ